jgi:hypothetical protein
VFDNTISARVVGRDSDNLEQLLHSKIFYSCIVEGSTGRPNFGSVNAALWRGDNYCI